MTLNKIQQVHAYPMKTNAGEGHSEWHHIVKSDKVVYDWTMTDTQRKSTWGMKLQLRAAAKKHKQSNGLLLKDKPLSFCLFLSLRPWCFRSRTLVFVLHPQGCCTLVLVVGGHQLSIHFHWVSLCRTPFELCQRTVNYKAFVELLVHLCHRFISLEVSKLLQAGRIKTRFLFYSIGSMSTSPFLMVRTQWKYSRTNQSNCSRSNAPRG